MKTYEIWIEEARMQGGGFDAQMIGSAEGETFRDAVLKWYKDHPLAAVEFNPKHLTEWGCGLFPTEEEARKRFG